VSRAEAYAPLPPERAELWAGYGRWEEVYFPSLVGLVVEEVRIDYCRMRLPWRRELTQPAGVVHGGVLATLIDSVAVPAIGAGYDEPREFATLDLQIQFVGAVQAEDMIVEGWVTRRGRSIVFCEAEVATASGRTAAKGMLTFRVLGSPSA
jgi:uncharacterized protein (TIGR00369 family)